MTYNLAKFAASILGPLVGKSPHHVRNTSDFVDKLKNSRVQPSEIVTSYDVVALFTSIPVKSAVDVIRQKLTADSSLGDRTNLSVDQVVEIAELCLNTTYFSYGGSYYKQISGCAMGSPLSPIVSNLYMESLEMDIMREYKETKPSLWLRYVDDTFVILNAAESEDFFVFINGRDPNIRFTREACKDGKIAFLDCLVSVEEDGSLSTGVYRKPTHTDQYLNFGSNHPLIHKLGVIRTLNHRANEIISDPEQVAKESAHIKGALQKCGYPDWAFRKAQRDRQRSSEAVSTRGKSSRAKIPYVPVVAERIQAALRPFGIVTVFKPGNTLRDKLVKVKDKMPREKQSNLVYGIPCGGTGCRDTYVGETKQALKTRLKQHRQRGSNPAQTSAVFLHHVDTKHGFEDSEVLVLDREEDWVRRGIKEAVWERIERPSLNRKGGLRFKLSNSWDRALQHIPRRLSRDPSGSRGSH